MATLERREQTPGKVSYRVRWWADGKQRSKSFKTHSDARRWKAVLEGDLVNGSYVDPKHGQTTLSAFSQGALDSLTLRVRPTTATQIRGVYRVHVAPEFGFLPLTAITGAGVSAWVVRKSGETSPATVRKAFFVLNRMMRLAVEHGLIKANPAASVELPAEHRNEQRFITQAEALTLADTIAPRFKAMVLVAVFGGLRFGELGGLQRKHVNPMKNTVTVKQTLIEIGGRYAFGPPKTKTSLRTVTLPRSVMVALTEHMDTYTGAEPDALVFTGDRGNPVLRSWFHRHYYQPATAKAGLSGLRFHDLRHTFVALWVSLGRNPKEVSKAAGHSSVAFTLDRYGHLYETDDDGLADQLDALLQADQS